MLTQQSSGDVKKLADNGHKHMNDMAGVVK
jgi:hypothetical protein